MIEAFQVGVRLAMTGNATQLLQEALRRLTGIEGRTADINNNFTTMAKLAGVSSMRCERRPHRKQGGQECIE